MQCYHVQTFLYRLRQIHGCWAIVITEKQYSQTHSRCLGFSEVNLIFTWAMYYFPDYVWNRRNVHPVKYKSLRSVWSVGVQTETTAGQVLLESIKCVSMPLYSKAHLYERKRSLEFNIWNTDKTQTLPSKGFIHVLASFTHFYAIGTDNMFCDFATIISMKDYEEMISFRLILHNWAA